MEKKDMTLIGIAIVICVIICVLSPYIASGDPDGLEKSAEDSGLPEDFSVEEINGIPEAIFPDYAFANDPENQALQVVALIIGVLVTLVVGYAVAEIVIKETTILNDSILANHDEESRPEIAKLRARNLLKYEIESAKKTHDQLEQVANFTLNKEASLNSYYYEGNNRDSFITIDQLKDEGKLTPGAALLTL